MSKVKTVVDESRESDIRALMRQKVKEEYGQDFFRMLYTSDNKAIETVTHVRGNIPDIQEIAYARWFEYTFMDYDNFRKLRKAEYSEYDAIPLYLRLMLSYQRKSRAEAIKAMIGDAIEKARSAFALAPRG